MIPAHSSGAACASSNPSGSAVGVALVDHGELGVTAVGVPAGEARAPGTGSRRRGGSSGTRPHVRRSQAMPTRSPTAKRVGRRRRAPRPGPTTSWPGTVVGPVRRQVALGQVQVGAAHAAGRHLDEHLAFTGGRVGTFAVVQRPAGGGAGPGDPPCLHRWARSAVAEDLGVLRHQGAVVVGAHQAGDPHPRPPAGDLGGVDADPVRLGADGPVVGSRSSASSARRAAPGGPALDQDAPAGAAVGVDVVDLVADGRRGGRGPRAWSPGRCGRRWRRPRPRS